MKKIISVVLLLALCIGCFAGCAPKEDAALNAAAEYLYAMYKDAKTTTDSNYTVVSQVRIDDMIYPITWTADAPENVKITAGENSMTTVEITAGEADVNYKLTATLKNADGLEVSVSFDKIIPAKAQVGGAIVLSYPKENKFISGSHYLYEAKNKWELNLTENKAEAIALEVVDNGDDTVSFKAGEYYLFCDATSVKFAKEQDDNTKFVLEAADTDGGYFIKCAVANYGGKAQYLEVYSGYLTCYGMGSDPSIYLFKLEEATGAAGTISGLETSTPETPEASSPETSTPAETTPAETTPPATNPPATNPPATNPPATNPPATNPPVTETTTVLKDGTYVIMSGNLAMTALGESANYGYPTGTAVTVSGSSVSGHYKANVFTIKNVTGGVTIQDIYGRYLYLSGTYNSFNVSKDLPSEGYIFSVAKSGSNYTLVCVDKNKTLAYSTSYTSYGVYATLSSDHNSALTILAATAPAQDPSTPSSGSGSSSSSNETISTPAAGTGISFDFTSLTGTGTEIPAGEALALFQGAASADGLTAVEVTKIYNGNSTGGAHPNSSGFLRCGKSDAAGELVMTFSKNVAKVEIVCHDWYSKSASNPTNKHYVAVNGGTAQLAPYNESGSGAVMTFNLDGTSNVVDFDFTQAAAGSIGRVFIWQIVVTFA